MAGLGQGAVWSWGLGGAGWALEDLAGMPVDVGCGGFWLPALRQLQRLIVVAYDKLIDGVVAMDLLRDLDAKVFGESQCAAVEKLMVHGAECDTIVGAVRTRGGVPLDMGRFYAQNCMTEATIVAADCAAVAVDA